MYDSVVSSAYTGALVMLGGFALIFLVLLVVARWKIFTKAGEAGWKSIVPIYSDYVQWKIAWKRKNLF